VRVINFCIVLYCCKISVKLLSPALVSGVTPGLADLPKAHLWYLWRFVDYGLYVSPFGSLLKTVFLVVHIICTFSDSLPVCEQYMAD